MGTGIKGNPNQYDFGYNHNYSLWVADSTVTLVNVPWNNDYRDIVKFANRAALNSYIDMRETSGVKLRKMTYIKPNIPIRIELPINAVLKYNYLRVTNPLQPVEGDVSKDFYYFILDANYVAPNTTEIVIQLDVWQTYGFDITFGNSYIERGHIGIANSAAFDNYGRDWLTVPEGIDIGGEYQVITKRTQKVMELDGSQGVGYENCSVMVVSSVNLLADPGEFGTENAPRVVPARGSYYDLMPIGAAVYVWSSVSNFFAWVGSWVLTEAPWVSSGIMSITLIPDVRRYSPGFTYETEHDGVWPTPAPWTAQPSIRYSLFNNWRNATEIINKIPERYRHLKKLLTYPYMAIEMTTWSGAPIVVKPESWADANATVTELATFIPPQQRIAFMPFKYNALPGSATDSKSGFGALGGDDNGEYLDHAVNIANFPTFPIINNAAITYLASQFNSLNYARESADWSQQRALGSAQASYDNANTGMLAERLNALVSKDSMNAVAKASYDALASNAVLGVATSIGGGAAGGAAAGGLPGAAGGAAGGLVSGAAGTISAGISQTQANALLANSMSTPERSTGVSQTAQGNIRDTNKSLADWAARGDYENTIAGINAKVRDANMIQPSVNGQLGGETLNIVNNQMGISLRWKMIDPAAIRVIGEYWLRYGYAVRKFSTIPASLMVMSKFTYWKLAETYIQAGAVPESFKQAIRGIFEKGVTVWNNPNDIGAIDIADNEPLPGVTL